MKDFQLEKKGQLSYFIIPEFKDRGILHGFSTRHHPEKFQELFTLNTSPCSLCQVHSSQVLVVEKDFFGGEEKGLPRGDGMVTALREVSLVMFSADCPVLFFYDPLEEVVGLAHAGWKGTVKGIGLEMVKTMEKVFGCSGQNILVGIGPSIGYCCYEVGDEVIEGLSGILNSWELTCSRASRGKWVLDLKEANAQLLVEGGLKRENIIISSHCTSCHPSLFYSYRRSRGDRDRMISFISLKDNNHYN